RPAPEFPAGAGSAASSCGGVAIGCLRKTPEGGSIAPPFTSPPGVEPAGEQLEPRGTHCRRARSASIARPRERVVALGRLGALDTGVREAPNSWPPIYAASIFGLPSGRIEEGTMSFRVVCISRSTAAGGESIGQAVAQRLDFRYVDEQIITKAAQEAQVDPALV